MRGQMRSLQESDAPALFALLKEVYSAPPFPMGGAWNLRLLETELERGGGLGLFGEDGLDSFILYSIQPGIWEISVLATRAERRRQGDMQRLLKELQARLPTETELWLEVHELNEAARHLYVKMGFREVGRRPGYYRDGAAACLYSYR